MLQWSCRLWFHYPAEGWGEHECRLSLFQGISYLLFLQGFLPCMSGSAACQGSGTSVSLIFLGCTECWPCIFRCPLFERWFEYLQPCWKGGNADFSFQSQESTCSNNCCPGVRSLDVLKFRVRQSAGQPHPCAALYFCTYTDKITPQNQKFLKPLD